jgi:hypothetical protein
VLASPQFALLVLQVGQERLDGGKEKRKHDGHDGRALLRSEMTKADGDVPMIATWEETKLIESLGATQGRHCLGIVAARLRPLFHTELIVL